MFPHQEFTVSVRQPVKLLSVDKRIHHRSPHERVRLEKKIDFQNISLLGGNLGDLDVLLDTITKYKRLITDR